MPRMQGWQEKRHQPFWDTLIRADTTTAPSPTLQASTQLFSSTGIGLQYWTNMKTPGMFSSDNLYNILAMRCALHFTGTNALLIYQLVAQQLFLTLNVGDKPFFQGPAWYFPAGGGIWGMDSATPAMVNGLPSQEAIVKFAKPIPVEARQAFNVQCDLYDMSTTSVRTNYLNSSTSVGIRIIQVYIDGLQTRDVQ